MCLMWVGKSKEACVSVVGWAGGGEMRQRADVQGCLDCSEEDMFQAERRHDLPWVLQLVEW